MNVPLSGGQGDGDYLYIFREVLSPVVREYAPELILVSAGFDTHGNDPLAAMRLSSSAYGVLTEILRELAQKCCSGHLVFTLEGGYDHAALSEGVAAVLGDLIRGDPGGRPVEGVQGESASWSAEDSETRQVVAKVRSVLSPYWKSLADKVGE